MPEAEAILRKFVQNNIADDKDQISIKPLASDGSNYTSRLFNVNVYCTHHDLSLFAKVATVSQELRIKMRPDIMYETERFVYTELVKIFENLQDVNTVPAENRFIFPKFYGCNATVGEELVVLQNLISAGYSTYDRYTSLNWEYAASAVTTLATFHALSYTLKKSDPKKYQEIIDKRKPAAKTEEDLSSYKQNVKESIEAISPENAGKVSGFFSGKELKDFDKYQQPLSTPVLVHGDYRVSNLLSKQSRGVTVTVCVDYQVVSTGSGLTDLLYLIVTGTDKAFRDQYYEKLVDLYYYELTQALRRLNVDPAEVYTRKTFEDELKQTLPYVLYLAVVVLPTVLSDAGLPRDLFVSRLNGVVDDVVAWGVV